MISSYISQAITIIIILIILLYVVLCKKNKKHLILKTVVTITSTALLLFCDHIGIENLFIKYDSPELAFQNGGFEGSIIKTIDTENSTLIIYGSKTTQSSILLNKIGSKWQIPFMYGEYHQKRIHNNGFISLYRESNSNNCYIIISAFNIDVNITDNHNSNFEEYSLSSHNSIEYNKPFKNYVAFIEDLDKDYYISIGNEKLFLFKEFEL